MSSSDYAVISVGTNSCRLLLASGTSGELRVDYHETRGTRLGEGLEESGRLDPAAVQRTLDAVRDYAALAAGAKRTFGIGTSALRDAADSASFSENFAETARVPLAILPGEEEASSSFEGAMRGLAAAGHAAPETACVVDVGGGSTEFAARQRRGEEPRVASLQIGAVRLTEKYLNDDPPTGAQVERCRQAVRAALNTLSSETAPRGMVAAVGGTANTAARMLRLTDEQSYGAVADIPAADLSALLKATLSMSVRERLRLHGLPAQRADIFPAGLLILNEVVSAANAGSLVVCESDLLLGYLARHL